MYNKYLKLIKFAFTHGEQARQKAIICDLDGTLAILNGRNPYDASTCVKDGINISVLEILHEFWNESQVIFISARSGVYRDQTIEWLNNTLSVLQAEHKQELLLFMREEGDTRPNEVVKKDLYNTFVKDKWCVKVVLDDSISVVKMWRSLGLLCIHITGNE